MAYPVVRTSTTSQTTTISKPSGTVAGDTLVLFVFAKTTTNVGPPTGFGGMWLANSLAGTVGWNAGACLRYCDGSEGASFTYTASGATQMCAVMARVSGVSSSVATTTLGSVDQRNPATAYTTITNGWYTGYGGGTRNGYYPGSLGLSCVLAYRAAGAAAHSLTTTHTPFFLVASVATVDTHGCLGVYQNADETEASLAVSDFVTGDSSGFLGIRLPAAIADRGRSMFM